MNNILRIAIRELGTSEVPARSNKTKYGEWFGLNGQPWCGIFVSYVYYMAGQPLGNLGFLKGFASCLFAVDYYMKKNKIVLEPMPGDIVFYSWSCNGHWNHTGIFEKKINDKMFYAIEGNTCVNVYVDNDKVMRKIRYFNKGVLFVRP